MATTTELQQKLLAKLRELFQLDQPDLDFGFYRVMHAKAKEINDYLDNKLPVVISAAFKDSGCAAVAEREAAYHAAVAQAQSFGAPDPEATEPVKKARLAWEEAKNGAGGEADVYDHLYHFFERYYDKGDFVSLRNLTRETDRKAKPYAIPYAGEEVMLHWANADQYYIKTSENFSHFTFDAAQHPDVVKMDDMARLAAKVPETLKVHFEIVDADEGEHGNIKAGKERFFILHDEKKCEVKGGEAFVYFEYREDPEMSGQTAKWQEKRRAEAVEALKTALPNAGLDKELCDFLYLNLDEGVKGKSPRMLLDVYLKRYFARNTEDYFIHKDLGGFLRRELDFYIKNDLMVLDDVASPNTTAESVAKWLDTLKVFRRIADDIITFLAQLEDFQKKLWLKKKFVVQCDYCITMDRVRDEALRAEVLANEKQQAAWKALGTGADPKDADKTAIDARMVDTQYFDESFKQKLLASIDNFDEQCDGVLVHSDNFQGMSLLDSRLRDQISGIYIDPPYNTGADGFIYRDMYKHSCWLSMMESRLDISSSLLHKDGSIFISINEEEINNLSQLMRCVYREGKYLSTYAVRVRHDNRILKGDKDVHEVYEFLLGYGATHEFKPFKRLKDNTSFDEYEWDVICHHDPDETCMMDGKEVEVYHPGSYAFEKKAGHETGCKRISVRGGLREGNSSGRFYVGFLEPHSQKFAGMLFKVKGIGSDALGYRYFWVPDEASGRKNGDYFQGVPVDRKDMLEVPCPNMLDFEKDFNNCADEGGVEFRNGKKPIAFLQHIFMLSRIKEKQDAVVLDYFGGSGSTGHSVIDMNRQDKGHRKYILIEMGDHFDTVLMPRVQKVVYSPDWKDGKPMVNTQGVSHCFKYLRLESYEDALNNLQVDGTRGAAFAGVGDYFFKYMLDVETKGSPSLLNVESFANPFGYKLVVKKPGSEEREERTVDLVETFNYLIGLRVKNTSATKRFTAAFERPKDEELPEDGHTKLIVKGGLKLAGGTDGEGAVVTNWSFRTVEGWVPKNRATPNDGAKERVLIVWRTLTGDTERDNAVLNSFLQREDVNALDGEYDVIYVNGSNNVPNLRKDADTWKVRLIEEDFSARMWEGL